jgi:signal transduction histidine kinase
MDNPPGAVNRLIRHDLRNDLNVIQTYADLIETGAGSTDTETELDRPSIVAAKNDEAVGRIETADTIVKTLGWC